MFRILNIFAVAVILCLNPLPGVQADELFSEIRPLSVFDTAATEDTAQRKVTSAKRITDSAALQQLLKEAAMDAKSEDARSAVTEKQLDKHSFPVLVSISEDETQMQIVLGLENIQNPVQQLSVETLLAFMTASQQHAPVLFSYHGSRKRTELSMMIENQGVTGQALRDQINRLAVIARDNAKLWTLTAGNNKKDATPAPPESQTTTAAPASRLTGKWSAARSATEAFAVQFTEPATFQLVYIKDRQQTHSTGSFTIADNTLTLTGTDGVKLQGSLKIVSPSEFRFQPTGTSELVFAKAK
jgi:hypothetical protein